MSEIKFIQRFGDELDRMIAADSSHQPATNRANLWTRLRKLIRNHRALTIILVAVTVAGCATAILVASPAQTTVAYGITCHNPKVPNAPVAFSGGVGYDSGSSFSADPLTACAFGMNIRRSRLVACVKPDVGVAVYIKTDGAGQCARMHLQPFSAKYRQALAQMVRLNDALVKLDYSRSCWKPSDLATATNAVLAEYQFSGWHAAVDSGKKMAYAGACGSFPTADLFVSAGANATQLLLDPHSHTVPIYYGAPLPVLIAMVDVQARMQWASYDEVLTLPRLRALVLSTFAHDAPHQTLRLVLQLSTVGDQNYLRANGVLRTYQRGGTILDLGGIGSPSGQLPVDGVYTHHQIGYFHRNITVTYTHVGH